MNKDDTLINPVLTTQELFEAQKDRLKLCWLAGKQGMDRPLEPANATHPGLALVGHLNFVHHNRIQIIGPAERTWLEALDGTSHDDALARLFTHAATAIVVVAGCEADETLIAAADQHGTPLFSTPLSSPVAIEYLQYYLTRALAPRLTVHGVFMEVMGTGVLITGESGIGKSELALELLSRNHRLIADDAVELIKVGPDVLVGQCPEALTDYMEVRGLGVINVRTMFGETSVRHKKKLHLIVHLKRGRPEDVNQLDRLQPATMTRDVMGVDIPQVILFVAPGRNLAVLLEAATRTYILRMWGINPLDDFLNRHQQLIDKS